MGWMTLSLRDWLANYPPTDFPELPHPGPGTANPEILHADMPRDDKSSLYVELGGHCPDGQWHGNPWTHFWTSVSGG